MFIGHFGVGFGAKKVAPTISLGVLFIAAQFLDLLWPNLLLLDWEHVSIEPGITKMAPLNFTDYPISHSLLMAIVWGLVVGGIYFLIKRKYNGAIILALCVVSHWVLDFLVHRPDLPLTIGGSRKVGLGLWNNVPVAILLESIVFVLGVVLYVRATKAKNKTGVFSLWGLIVFFAVIYIANIFGSPPPSVSAIAWVGQSQWLFILWAFWVDKNRKPKLSESGTNHNK